MKYIIEIQQITGHKDTIEKEFMSDVYAKEYCENIYNRTATNSVNCIKLENNRSIYFRWKKDISKHLTKNRQLILSAFIKRDGIVSKDDISYLTKLSNKEIDLEIDWLKRHSYIYYDKYIGKWKMLISFNTNQYL